MAAVILEVTRSFYINNSKKRPFISANTYEKCIVSQEFCIAHQGDKMCFLPICSYHIILIGQIIELLQKLNAFSFNYQHVDCLCALFKHRFTGKIVVKIGQLFGIAQRAVHSNHQNRGVDRMPSFSRKRLLRKKNKKNIRWDPLPED